MSQAIIFTNDNGGVSVCIPTGELSIDQVIAQAVPEGVLPIIVNSSDIPEDKEFRNAWELVDGVVTVNQTKKQAIIDAEQTKVTAKESALAKLAALGLSEDEVKALVG